MVVKFNLGTFLKDGESLHTEYKEFCLKENIYKFFTEKQVSCMLRDSKLPRKFDNVVLYNICKYIDIYIAKYAASYHNSIKAQKDMTFMIGINDFSEITGIPYTKNLKDDICLIKRYITNALNINLNDMCCIGFNVTIDQCEIDEDLLDDEDFNKQLMIYDRAMNWYKIKYRKYNKKRKQWIKSIMKYKGKLQMVYEDMDFQEEFKDYLQSQDKFEEFNGYFESTTTITNANNNKYIIDVEKIKDYKKDSNSFVYWLIQFKDMKVQELMRNKPKAPTFPKSQNIELASVTQLTNLRKRWVASNNKLKYFVLSINLHKKNTCDNTVKYCDPRRRNWRLIKRCMQTENGPYSKDV